MRAAIALAEWRLMIGDNDNESSIDKLFCTSHASICRSICAIRMSSTMVNDCHSIDDKWHDTLNDSGSIICDRLVAANRSSSGTSHGRISNKPPLASTMSYCVFCYNNSRFSVRLFNCCIIRRTSLFAVRKAVVQDRRRQARSVRRYRRLVESSMQRRSRQCRVSGTICASMRHMWCVWTQLAHRSLLSGASTEEVYRFVWQ